MELLLLIYAFFSAFLISWVLISYWKTKKESRDKGSSGDNEEVINSVRQIIVGHREEIDFSVKTELISKAENWFQYRQIELDYNASNREIKRYERLKNHEDFERIPQHIDILLCTNLKTFKKDVFTDIFSPIDAGWEEMVQDKFLEVLIKEGIKQTDISSFGVCIKYHFINDVMVQEIVQFDIVKL